MEECEGYPFVFQMIDRDSADEWLIEKNSCSDCDDLAKRITVAVKKLFSRH